MALDTKDPKTQVMFILIILIAGAWFAFINYVHSPAKEEIAKKEAKLDELRTKYYTAKKVADRLPDAKRELERMEKQWKEAQKKLPDEKQMQQLLVQLTSMGMRNNIKFLKFEPLAPRPPKGFYNENVINISVEGTYHQLVYFFNEIANLTRIIKIERVEISSIRSRGNSQYTIRADFQAIAYAFVKGGGASRASSSKTKGKG